MAYFDNVKFYLSSSLVKERRAELKHVLYKYGGREAKSIISISAATHIITDTNKFKGSWMSGGRKRNRSRYGVSFSLSHINKTNQTR
jgi:hypothetical protein